MDMPGMSMNMSNMSMNKSATHMEDGHMMPDSSSIMTMSMQMVFYLGVDVTVLFSQWKVRTPLGLAGTLICWFCLAVAYQGLKRLRMKMKQNRRIGQYSSSMPQSPNSSKPEGSTNALMGQPGYNILPEQGQPSRSSLAQDMLHHLLQTLLQFIQTTLSFALMLVFMTYNGWLALAILLGDALGYFLFFWKVDGAVGDHCG